MSQIKDAKVKNMVSALGTRQDESNQALDINSLMTAFTDFLRLAKLGNCGVPLNCTVEKMHPPPSSSSVARSCARARTQALSSTPPHTALTAQTHFAALSSSTAVAVLKAHHSGLYSPLI